MNYTILLGFLSVWFTIGAAIRCYECNSANNSMCLDPQMYQPKVRAAYLNTVECGAKMDMPGSHEFFCRKILQTIMNKDRGPDVRVTRGCGWVRHHKNCYRADTGDHYEISCQCFNDECNGSIRNTLWPYLPIFTAIYAFLP